MIHSKLKVLLASLTALMLISLLTFDSQAQSNRVPPTPPQTIEPEPEATPAESKTVTDEKAALAAKAFAAQPVIDEQSTKILQQAAEALGGSNYLNVRTVIGKGFYSTYREGKSNVPLKFVDYIAYPDKERTEFRGEDTKIIQSNSGETGWLYDGSVRSLKDMKPDQIADFKFAMRINVDNLLRGVWRKEGAKVAYAGRREAGIGKRNLAVRVTYPDGFNVEFEFGAQDHIPAKVVYTRKNPEDETEEFKEEDRLAKFVSVNGILAPFVIDHYRSGAQTSRINYESIEFNAPVPDTLFARPENAKAVK